MFALVLALAFRRELGTAGVVAVALVVAYHNRRRLSAFLAV